MLQVQKLLGAYNVPYCPEVQVTQVLRGQEYMGIWFEQTRVKNEWFQSDSSICTQAYYFDLKESGEFWVQNSTQEDLNSERIGKVGHASCSSGDGNCNVSFTEKSSKKSNYKIVDTDYSNYSIVYSCLLGFEYLWILTREAQISGEEYEGLKNKVLSILPSFDLERLIDQEYQGEYCNYINYDKFI